MDMEMMVTKGEVFILTDSCSPCREATWGSTRAGQEAEGVGGKYGLKPLLPGVPHQQIPRVKGFGMYILYFRLVWDFMFPKSGHIVRLKCIFHMLPGSGVYYLKERAVFGRL